MKQESWGRRVWRLLYPGLTYYGVCFIVEAAAAVWIAFTTAGRYDAVRVDIGRPGSYGQNWWCVLYPGLCAAACGGYDDPAQTDLVCGDYILRFRAVEWWQQLTASRADRVLVML